MKLIIPISGKAQHGKDSAAKILKEKLEDEGYRVLIMHYADYLKFGCTTYLGWDGAKDEVGRTLLQKVGTEEVRKKYPDFWVETVCKWISGSLKKYYDVFLIPDTRFENEINYLKTFRFNTEYKNTNVRFEPFAIVPVRVSRLNFYNELTQQQKAHPSETGLDDFPFDYYIQSQSGINALQDAVDGLVCYLKEWYLC